MKIRPPYEAWLAIVATAAVLVYGGIAHAQTAKTPSAPTPAPAASAASQQPHLPPVNPANFTATSPTKAEVDAFLKASWGYDHNRIWEVAAILKTEAPGVSKVVVFVAEKGNSRVGDIQFFVTPDGKHLIAGNTIVDFGPDPFQHAREVLQQQANGPWTGSSTRTHELVEFADMECPHCKAAQPIAAKLRTDFPHARYVFENFPLVEVHPEAFLAADYGDCVAKAGGNTAFFKYVDSVFANQDKLTPSGAKTTLDNAVTAAGLDPAKIAACAATPAGKQAVEDSMKLGHDLHVDQTPTLYVDGRPVPMEGIPYDTLKQIIEYQFSLDSGAGTAAAK